MTKELKAAMNTIQAGELTLVFVLKFGKRRTEIDSNGTPILLANWFGKDYLLDANLVDDDDPTPSEAALTTFEEEYLKHLEETKAQYK